MIALFLLRYKPLTRGKQSKNSAIRVVCCRIWTMIQIARSLRPMLVNTADILLPTRQLSISVSPILQQIQGWQTASSGHPFLHQWFIVPRMTKFQQINDSLHLLTDQMTARSVLIANILLDNLHCRQCRFKISWGPGHHAQALQRRPFSTYLGSEKKNVTQSTRAFSHRHYWSSEIHSLLHYRVVKF